LGVLPTPPACIACGATVTTVAMEEHLLDRAVSVGAELETVSESDVLAGYGGVAAIIDPIALDRH
jgi:hypothetical protein